MKPLFAVLLLVLAGCADPAVELLGIPIDTSPFDPVSESAGIHPSVDVLEDPANFFRSSPPTEDAKWDIQAYGDPKLSYYAFATALTRVPTGENQFYVGVNLRRMGDLELVSPDKTSMVRQMTIDAFETVIEQFPNDLTYEADGVTAYKVADFARAELESFLGQ